MPRLVVQAAGPALPHNTSQHYDTRLGQADLKPGDVWAGEVDRAARHALLHRLLALLLQLQPCATIPAQRQLARVVRRVEGHGWRWGPLERRAKTETARRRAPAAAGGGALGGGPERFWELAIELCDRWRWQTGPQRAAASQAETDASGSAGWAAPWLPIFSSSLPEHDASSKRGQRSDHTRSCYVLRGCMSRRASNWAPGAPAALHRAASTRPWALARSNPLPHRAHSIPATVAREQPTARTHPALRHSMALLLW